MVRRAKGSSIMVNLDMDEQIARVELTAEERIAEAVHLQQEAETAQNFINLMILGSSLRREPLAGRALEREVNDFRYYSEQRADYARKARKLMNIED